MSLKELFPTQKPPDHAQVALKVRAEFKNSKKLGSQPRNNP